MGRELIKAKAEVIHANTEELFSSASAKGIQMPHPALTIWSCLLAEIEVPNENDVRLGKEATLEAVKTAMGTQININHNKKGYVCGHIIDAELKNKKDIWITCIGFKHLYAEEFAYAEKLIKQNKLAMSFEISADVDSQDKLKDGTRRINDYYFTGAGLLLGVPPACTKAYVQEMAQKIEKERYELICAKKSTNSIIESILKVLGNNQNLDANYNCECVKCGEKISSEQHCKDIQCPKCGGEMRRENRPSKSNRASEENKGESKVELKELKEKLIAELGEDVVKDWTDEDFQNEEKVAEALKAKEETSSEEISEPVVENDEQNQEAKSEETTEDASEEKDEAQVVEMETTQKVTSETDDNGKETVIEEQLVIQKVDGKEVYRRKTNEERMYAQADVDALQTTIDELKASLEAKDSEIEEVRANAEKIGQLKVQYKDNEFTAEFKSEDWLDEAKIQEAVAKKETAELIAKNKEELKENEFAKDFSDEDYANSDKVELAKIKAENKALKEKKETEEAEAEANEEEETVEAKKDDDLDTGADAERQDEFASIKDPIARMIARSRKAKEEKNQAKK